MVVNIIGWIGTLLVLGAYFMVSSDRLKPRDNIYNSMNLFGAICIGLNVLVNHAWPALGLQLAWAAVAIISLFKNFRLQSKR